jgi:hypothetical protein
MRFWLAILLLVCMPLQWASAANGPLDGGSRVTHHVAHSTSATTESHTALHTTDCGTCHHGCSLALLGDARALPATPHTFPMAQATPLPASRPADLPERPQWRLRG